MKLRLLICILCIGPWPKTNLRAASTNSATANVAGNTGNGGAGSPAGNGGPANGNANAGGKNAATPTGNAAGNLQAEASAIAYESTSLAIDTLLSEYLAHAKLKNDAVFLLNAPLSPQDILDLYAVETVCENLTAQTNSARRMIDTAIHDLERTISIEEACGKYLALFTQSPRPLYERDFETFIHYQNFLALAFTLDASSKANEWIRNAYSPSDPAFVPTYQKYCEPKLTAAKVPAEFAADKAAFQDLQEYALQEKKESDSFEVFVARLEFKGLRPPSPANKFDFPHYLQYFHLKNAAYVDPENAASSEKLTKATFQDYVNYLDLKESRPGYSLAFTFVFYFEKLQDYQEPSAPGSTATDYFDFLNVQAEAPNLPESAKSFADVYKDYSILKASDPKNDYLADFVTYLQTLRTYPERNSAATGSSLGDFFNFLDTKEKNAQNRELQKGFPALFKDYLAKKPTVPPARKPTFKLYLRYLVSNKFPSQTFAQFAEQTYEEAAAAPQGAKSTPAAKANTPSAPSAGAGLAGLASNFSAVGAIVETLNSIADLVQRFHSMPATTAGSITLDDAILQSILLPKLIRESKHGDRFKVYDYSQRLPPLKEDDAYQNDPFIIDLANFEKRVLKPLDGDVNRLNQLYERIESARNAISLWKSQNNSNGEDNEPKDETHATLTSRLGNSATAVARMLKSVAGLQSSVNAFYNTLLGVNPNSQGPNQQVAISESNDQQQSNQGSQGSSGQKSGNTTTTVTTLAPWFSSITTTFPTNVPSGNQNTGNQAGMTQQQNAKAPNNNGSTSNPQSANQNTPFSRYAQISFILNDLRGKSNKSSYRDIRLLSVKAIMAQATQTSVKRTFIEDFTALSSVAKIYLQSVDLSTGEYLYAEEKEIRGYCLYFHSRVRYEAEKRHKFSEPIVPPVFKLYPDAFPTPNLERPEIKSQSR